MYNKYAIFSGLAIFILVATSPLWTNAGRDIPAPKPSLDTPAIQKLADKDRQCVLPTAEMRARHMQLLIDWREQVVRTGNRVWVSPTGKKFEPSLTNTCLGCHSNKAQFCDTCHNYVAVTPNCWGCHLDKAPPTGKMAQAEVK
uniref:Menaquinol oxidoreductase n=1 Tax=Desulfobacca acetoxidans TaxID=60893 RepID=A0A7C5AKA9_9BACT